MPAVWQGTQSDSPSDDDQQIVSPDWQENSADATPGVPVVEQLQLPLVVEVGEQ